MDTRLLKKQLTAAYQYSYTRLVLNYYTFFETIAEETEIPQQTLRSIETFNRILGSYYAGEKIEADLLQLRDQVIGEVEVLTVYTDCFQIYEYILNRLERKFKDLPETDYNDEAFANQLMTFITDTKDSVVMNGRIKQVIGQLPVRMTKQKFFSLIKEGLSVYIGSPRESLHDMMYVLRTESMAGLPENMAEGHKELFESLEQFRVRDYKNISKEAYEEAAAIMDLSSGQLMKEAGIYMALQDLINDLLVMILSSDDAVTDVNEEDLYESLVSEILERLTKEDYEGSEVSFYDRLTQMEGRQEAYYERYLRCELPEEDEELKHDPDYVKAVNVDRLLSGSSFASLMQLSTEAIQMDAEMAAQPVDRQYLEETAESYFKELEEVFAGTTRPVMRSIMAKVLSDLPVYFNSIDEISAYIRGSLTSCMDEAEKRTCKELMEELMDYENNLV